MGSIKKQAKGARQDGMRHQAKIEGFVVSLRYRQGRGRSRIKGVRRGAREGKGREEKRR